MRSVGIDTASAGYSAISLAVNGKPKKSVVWKPEDKKESNVVVMEKFYNWIYFQLEMLNPDVVAVEELEVFQAKKTIRQLARYEGIALLAAKKKCRVVLSSHVKSARGAVFPKGGSMSKDEAFKQFKKKYPHVKLRAKNAGGEDQCDAYVHALAAPILLERR